MENILLVRELSEFVCLFLHFSSFVAAFFLLSFLFHSLLQCCLSVDIFSVCLFCMVRIDMDTCIACDWNWVSARFVVIRILCRHNRSLARCRRNTIRFMFGINRNSCACVLVLVSMCEERAGGSSHCINVCGKW